MRSCAAYHFPGESSNLLEGDRHRKEADGRTSMRLAVFTAFTHPPKIPKKAASFLDGDSRAPGGAPGSAMAAEAREGQFLLV